MLAFIAAGYALVAIGYAIGYAIVTRRSLR
jgi:hypothetical protein